MNAAELDRLLSSAAPPVLLHVLPEEVFEARRIRGSRNACVYETAFLDKVASIVPDRNATIVVYGAGKGSADGDVALGSLRAAGYSRVDVLTGGMDGWIAAGFPCEGTDRLPESPVLHGTYRIDPAASPIRWTGRNLFNQHYGLLRLASGEIRIERGDLVAAGFAVDMNSITCDDLTDSQWNAMLIAHLRTADFFDADRHPAADFVVDSVEPVRFFTEGTPTHRLKGRLTLRGETRPLEFPMVLASADGSRLTGQAQFEFDRTEFGSIYGSGRFFRFLGRHVVNDAIHVQVMIHAARVD